MTRDVSWLGIAPNSPGVNVCCATFPHLGPDGKTVLKDKYCYPRTVLNMEQDYRYLLPNQVNPYPLAWCHALSMTVGLAFVLTSAIFC